MKLYFRLLSRAITPVVLAAACLNGTPAVAMHHNDDDAQKSNRTLTQIASTSASTSAPPIRQVARTLEDASPTALVRHTRGAQQIDALPPVQPAQDLIVLDRPLSTVFQSFNFQSVLSSLVNLSPSEAHRVIESKLTQHVKMAIDPLRIQRHALQAQEAESAQLMKASYTQLEAEETALTQLLANNASHAEEALKAYERGILEVERLSALQAENKKRIAAFAEQEKQIKSYGASAIEALTQELQRLQQQGRQARPSAEDGNHTHTLLVLPKTLEALKEELITTDIQSSQKALQTYKSALEGALETMQLSGDQQRDVLKVSGWLGRIEAELDQKWADAEKLREALEARERAVRQKKEAEEAAAEKARREAPYIAPLTALREGYSKAFEKQHTMKGADHNEKVARFNEGMIRQTALALKESDPAEIKCLLDLMQAEKSQESSAEQYYQTHLQDLEDYVSRLACNMESFYQRITARQILRRQVAQEMFAGLSGCAENIFKERVAAEVQDYAVSTDQDADGEDYTHIGINNIYIRSSGYDVQLTKYKEYVERTFRWLSPEDQKAHQGVLQALKEMEQEAQRSRLAISASSSTSLVTSN